VDGVVIAAPDTSREIHQRVHLHELERVVGVRLDVDADDVEPGAVVAD
jgi:hypothetical protein